MFKNSILSLSLAILALANFSFLQGVIVETNEISTAIDTVNSNSLVLLNITGTLYKPSTTLSNHQWREYFEARATELLPNAEVKNRLVRKVKNDIVQKIPKMPVETITPTLISQLQNKKIPVLGITKKQMSASYAENFGFITSQHLKSIGVDLEKTVEFFPMQTPKDAPYHFAYGIIFTNNKPVGPALAAFLQNVENKPSQIIMVDNTRSSLESVEAALAESKTSFNGYRYNVTDADKINFDPILGIIEFIAFYQENRVMQDVEALEIKKANPDVNYPQQLDQLIQSMAD